MAVSAEVLREKVKELGEDAAKLLYLLYLYTYKEMSSLHLSLDYSYLQQHSV